MSDTAHANSNIRESCNVHYTIYKIKYTIYNIQYTIYNIQYTIYNTEASTPLDDEVEVEDGLQCRAVGLIVGIIS